MNRRSFEFHQCCIKCYVEGEALQIEFMDSPASDCMTKEVCKSMANHCDGEPEMSILESVD